MDVVAVSQVCKQFRDICEEESLWKNLALKDFSVMCQDRDGNYITPQNHWKTVYKVLHLLKVLDQKSDTSLWRKYRKYAMDDRNCPFCSRTLEMKFDVQSADDPPVKLVCPKCHFFLFDVPCCGCGVIVQQNTWTYISCRV